MKKSPGRPLTPVTDEQKQQVALLMARGMTIQELREQTQLGLRVLRRIREMPEVIGLALQYRMTMLDALEGGA